MKLSLFAILLGLAALTGKLGAASGAALLLAFVLFGVEILRLLAGLFGMPERTENLPVNVWFWVSLALTATAFILKSPWPAAAALVVALVGSVISGLTVKTPR